MKKTPLILLFLAMATLIFVQVNAQQAQVTICHHTGSQTNPTVTITVAEAALSAHFAHGDTIGACATTTPPQTPPVTPPATPPTSTTSVSEPTDNTPIRGK